MLLCLHLTAAPQDGGDPFIIGSTTDRSAIAHAAVTFVREAQDRSRELQNVDPILGQLQQLEAARLQESLDLIIPDMPAV